MQKAVKYSKEVLVIAFLASGLICVAACTGWKGMAAAEQDLSEQPRPSQSSHGRGSPSQVLGGVCVVPGCGTT